MVFMFSRKMGLFKELFSIVLRTKNIIDTARSREIDSIFEVKPLNILYIYLQNK